MYIVTTSQMQAAERAANDSGLSYEQMMENAGRAVAEVIAARFELTGVRVLVLVGPGNNGGDGLVVARHLARMGASVTVYVWKRGLEGDKNWDLLEDTGVEKVINDDSSSHVRLVSLLDEAGIIVDALLGTGGNRPIEGSLAHLLAQTRTAIVTRRAPKAGPFIDLARPDQDEDSGPVVVAVDVPSGLNSDTGAVDPQTLAADLTVTLAAVKQGHIRPPGPEVVGQLIVGDIGLTQDHYPAGLTLEMATPVKVAAILPDRPVTAHKGTFGTAMLVAGCLNYTGAAILAGQAALRIGTGLVRMAPPLAIQPIIASRLAEAVYLPLPHTEGVINAEAVPLLREKFAGTDALLIGPGLGQAGPTEAFLKELFAGRSSSRRRMGFKPEGTNLDNLPAMPPLILDADALNILARQEEWWRLLPPHSILTPHPGEMARLSGQETGQIQARRLEIAQEMAAQWNQVILLKGAFTLIAAPDGRVMGMPFANPALAKAGSGDVLAGSIVGLRAQGLAPFEAAVAGAYLHGLAGEMARESLGVTAVTAGDLISFLPLAIRQIRRE